MNKFIFLLFVAVGLLAGCSHNISTPQAYRAKMVRIAPRIFVDSEMPPQQRQLFLTTVKQSEKAIEFFFGDIKATPVIYACSTKSCFRKFGGIQSRAKAIDDNQVFLSYRGLDKVTVTHELAHVELHKRLGHEHWSKVPMWFDEGLAVLVCKDPRYVAKTPVMPVTELVTQQQWIRAVQKNKPVYSTAKQVVEGWYQNVGREGLEAVLKRLQQGSTFSLNDKVVATLP